METERDEKATAESDTDLDTIAAVLALRSAALKALRAGIQQDWAGRFVEAVMELGDKARGHYGLHTAYLETHRRNMAGTARDPDVGFGGVSWDDDRDS